MVFRCMHRQMQERQIHVAGTGVCGFRTDYFNPTEIWNSEYKKMCDLVFSLEAAKQHKRIIVLPHAVGYFKEVKVPKQETIFGTHVKEACREQQLLADSILSLSPL